MSIDPFVLPLRSAYATELLVGSKAARLSILSRIDIPIPPAFIVTTVAFKSFVDQHRLLTRINDIEHQCDFNDLRQVTEAATSIRYLFGSRAIPKAVERAIAQAYNTTKWELPVAVRSSASTEDLPGASFAGQQESFLNIRSLSAILQAVRACWSSPWSEHAMTYRFLRQVKDSLLTVSVIVQNMVMADVAGVMFTANPTSGNPNEIIINSNWGLGDSVASGDVVPDHIVMEKSSGRIVDVRIGSKTHQSAIRVEGSGTYLRQIDQRRRDTLSLTESQLKMLMNIGCQIESLFGEPQDIEWAFAQDRLAVLQARPITTLAKKGS